MAKVQMVEITLDNSHTTATEWSLLKTLFVLGPGEYTVQFDAQLQGEPHFRLFNHARAEVSHIWEPMPYSGWVSESIRLPVLSTTRMGFEWCTPTGIFSEILNGTLRVFPPPAGPLIVLHHTLDTRPPTAWDRIMGEDPF